MKRLLIDKKGRRQLVEEGADLHTHGGVIKKEDLEAVDYNGLVKTHMDKTFYILAPTATDLVEKMEKRAQIVYPKDSAIIIGLTGISDGSRIVEAGTGVAGMTIMLANATRPSGCVYTYELREEHQKEAKKNLKNAGLEDNVTMKLKSIYDGIDEDDLDCVILDLPEPWEVSKHAAKALKMGGFLVSYSPSVEQVRRFVCTLPRQFQDTSTFEVLLRDWEISDLRCRPKTRMIGHTGFITITRKMTE